MSSKNIYDERKLCLEKMINNTKDTIYYGEQYVTITLLEQKEHINAYNNMERLQQEYNRLYESCEKFIKTK